MPSPRIPMTWNAAVGGKVKHTSDAVISPRSNDHKPPHIHIECPPGTPRTRYHWPELTPLRDDRPLRAAEEKRLRKYLEVHGPAIDRKITSTPWK